jgi:hypothetical protein
MTEHGKASAAKRGRRAEWPYVPVIIHGEYPFERTEQIRAKAFANRPDALAYAERVIEARREALARKLADPRHRALRAQHHVA